MNASMRAVLAVAAVLALAGCGDSQIVNPANATSSVRADSAVIIASTRAWRLKAVTLDGRPIIDRFPQRSGGAVTRAVSEPLAMDAGEHRLTATVDVGANDVTKSVVFSVGLPPPTGLFDLQVPPDMLVTSPVPMTVVSSFDWHGLRVETQPRGRQRSSRGHLFDRQLGTATQIAQARLMLAPANYCVFASARDFYGRVLDDWEMVRVVAGYEPYCNVGITDVPSWQPPGRTIPRRHGGGRWAYQDATRSRCIAQGGDYSQFKLPSLETVCRPSNGTRRMVGGAWLCVTGGGSQNEDDCQAILNRDHPATVDTCPDLCTDTRSSCTAGQRKDTSAGADGSCMCAPCPTDP